MDSLYYLIYTATNRPELLRIAGVCRQWKILWAIS